MNAREQDILNAVSKGRLRSVRPPLVKLDFFIGDDPLIAKEEVLSHIHDVIELLADRGEHIGSAEWRELEYGKNKNQSLKQLAGDSGKDIDDSGAYICNEGTKARMQQFAPPDYSRTGQLFPPRSRDNEKFWQYCATNDVECARKLWGERDIDIEYMFSDITSAGMAFSMHVTPLTAAVYVPDNMPLITFLLDAGANPDTRAEKNCSPLMIAAEFGQDASVMAMVDAICKRYPDDPAARLDAFTCKADTGETVNWCVETRCNAATYDYFKKAIDKAKKQLSGNNPPDAPAPAAAPRTLVPNLLASLEGKPLTRDMLLASHEGGATLLRKIIEYLQVGKALDMLHASGERLTREDLLQRESSIGGTNLERIAQTGQLAVFFDPKYWTGRVREMQDLWRLVPPDQQEQMDGNDGRPSFRRNLQMTNAASARSLGGGAGR